MRRDLGSAPCGCNSAHQELPFGTDIPNSAAERKGNCQPGEQEGYALDQRFRDSLTVTECADDRDPYRFPRIVAAKREDDSIGDECGEKDGNGK